MKPDGWQVEPSTANEGVNLLSVYRSMLRIVARLNESEYTDDRSSSRRQTEVQAHSDLADPASEKGTSQG